MTRLGDVPLPNATTMSRPTTLVSGSEENEDSAASLR